MADQIPAGAKVTESIDCDPVQVDILEWPHYAGITEVAAIEMMHMLHASNMPVRQVRLSLKAKTGVVLEAGALQFYDGDFDIENKIKAGKIARRVFGSMVTGESTFRPLYRGQGTIWLEPSFSHFLLLGLDNETIIVDQGMFLCCEQTVDVTAEIQKNVSSALFGGEGLFQTKLSGSGFVVLSSPVPESEIVKMQVEPGRKIAVDGSFALLRGGSVTFKVEKSSRSWLGTSTTGEGLLQTFTGKGEVWVAPTLPVYENLAQIAHSFRHPPAPTERQ